MICTFTCTYFSSVAYNFKAPHAKAHPILSLLGNKRAYHKILTAMKSSLDILMMSPTTTFDHFSVTNFPSRSTSDFLLLTIPSLLCRTWKQAPSGSKQIHQNQEGSYPNDKLGSKIKHVRNWNCACMLNVQILVSGCIRASDKATSADALASICYHTFRYQDE